jgi:enterochelin esterase family protein
MSFMAWILRSSLNVTVMCLLAWGIMPTATGASATGADASPASELESPRLRTLAAALRAGEATALDVFWGEVDKTHSPLIESIPGHPNNELFTFIWRAQPDQAALNVLFNGWFPLHKTTGFDSFTRLGNSNVWYTSYVLPRNAHVRYELISPKGWQPAADRVAYFTRDGVEYEAFQDPLNPQIVNWNNSARSYAQGHAATISPYLRKHDETPAGRVETLPIESKILHNSRVLRVYLPPDYATGKASYGLLLAYDGNQYTEAVPTPTILDNMIAARVIPPVVAVFLESPDRDVEFPPNDSFQQFIATELLPLLRTHYRISRDPRRNAVLGSSYGGLAATYTAFTHPNLFGNVISQSGTYGWFPTSSDQVSQIRGVEPNSGWLIERLAEAPRKQIRFYFDAGIWEGNILLFSNRMLRSVLAGKGYDVVYNESDGTHSSYYWMLRLPDGLQATLGKSAWP